MFTGIIEEIGTIERIQRGRNSAILHIRAAHVLEDAKLGDSIAVNGICLTITSLTRHSFCADVMHETLDRSSLSQKKPGDHINLERAMAANGRFGGHIVTGHIDGTGSILQIQKDDNAIWFTVNAASPLMRYIVEKGSITIDGISLTIAKVHASHFAISAIPHTVSITTLGERQVGDVVNLEVDVIGKYVEKMLGAGDPSLEKAPLQKGSGAENAGITQAFLAKCGY